MIWNELIAEMTVDGSAGSSGRAHYPELNTIHGECAPARFLWP